MKHFRDTLWRKMVFGKTRNFYREITENNCPKKKETKCSEKRSV